MRGMLGHLLQHCLTSCANNTASRPVVVVQCSGSMKQRISPGCAGVKDILELQETARTGRLDWLSGMC